MSDPVIAALIPKQWPGYVRVVTSAAQQFPNPKGAGGCLVQNLDSNYAVDLAPTVDFVPAQTRTIQPLQPYQWVADTPLWCRLTPSQIGSPVDVNVFVQPGGIAAPPTNPVQGAALTSATGSGTVTVNPNVQALALNILAPGNATVEVQGTTTLTSYPVLLSSPAFYSNNAYWLCPICTAEDASYTVSVTPASGFPTWYVAAIYAGATSVVNAVADGGPVFTTLVSASSGVDLSGIIAPPGTAALRILASTGPTNPPKVGTDSVSGQIAPYFPVRLLDIQSDGSTWWESIMPSGTAINITFPTTCTATLYAVTRASQAPTCPTSWTVTVPDPAAGAEWSYTTTTDARLRYVQCVYTTDATSATRYPCLSVNGGPSLSLAPAGITASNGGDWLLAYPGAPVPGQLSAGSNVWERGLPDYGALPAGTTISSNVQGSGIEPGDQWSQIVLTFSAV